jgi:hypothetical protein
MFTKSPRLNTRTHRGRSSRASLAAWNSRFSLIHHCDRSNPTDGNHAEGAELIDRSRSESKTASSIGMLLKSARRFDRLYPRLTGTAIPSMAGFR